MDLGLDSIVGVTWVRKINETYGLEVEATKVYSHPTLTQLSGHVKDEAERRGTLPKPTARTGAEQVQALKPAQIDTCASGLRRPHLDATSRATRMRERRRAGGNASRLPTAGDRGGRHGRAIPAGDGPRPVLAEPRRRPGLHHRGTVRPLGHGSLLPARCACRGPHQQPLDGRAGAIPSVRPAVLQYFAEEAEYIDPQQRLFLQTCWQAIEDAGYDTRSLSVAVAACSPAARTATTSSCRRSSG